MLSLLIILSLGILSLVLFAISAWFWFPIWRIRKSGTAHGLFLTNAGLALIVLFWLIQIVTKMVTGGECEFPFNITSAILMTLVGIFQFSLSRGYFNFKE